MGVSAFASKISLDPACTPDSAGGGRGYPLSFLDTHLFLKSRFNFKSSGVAGSIFSHCRKNAVWLDICENGLKLPKFHTAAAIQFSPSFKNGAMSIVS